MSVTVLVGAVVAATLGAARWTAAESPSSLLRGRVRALCAERAWLRERASWLAGGLAHRRMLLQIASAGEERIEELEAIYEARRVRLRRRLERLDAEIETTRVRIDIYERRENGASRETATPPQPRLTRSQRRRRG